MNRWKGFKVGQRVIIVGTALVGQHARIIDIMAVGPLHFIEVVFNSGLRSSLRPSSVRVLNALEQLAYLDDEEAN